MRFKVQNLLVKIEKMPNMPYDWYDDLADAYKTDTSLNAFKVS